MALLRHPQGVICFTNPEQLKHVYANGTYGNVSIGDRPIKTRPQAATAAKKIRFGKQKDLLNVTQDDLVFLFETGTSILHGVWKVSGEPFFCTTKIFDSRDSYPYRFRLNKYLEFPNPVPIMELRKLLDKGVIWSLRTFERESNAPFASVNPISASESEAILDLFWRYNHGFVPPDKLIPYTHKTITHHINFYNLVLTNKYSSRNDLRLEANNLGTYSGGTILEETLHCYLLYNLARRSAQMINTFRNYSQVLREVPVSIAGQHRVDVLLIYENPTTRKPSVFSLMEVKRGEVSGVMLRQLLEYIKLFSERHNVDPNAIEGIYVGSEFTEDALDYAQKRATIEVERPLRLIKYEIIGNKLNLSSVV